jgi:hypothetical protein
MHFFVKADPNRLAKHFSKRFFLLLQNVKTEPNRVSKHFCKKSVLQISKPGPCFATLQNTI